MIVESQYHLSLYSTYLLTAHFGHIISVIPSLFTTFIVPVPIVEYSSGSRHYMFTVDDPTNFLFDHPVRNGTRVNSVKSHEAPLESKETAYRMEFTGVDTDAAPTVAQNKRRNITFV